MDAALNEFLRNAGILGPIIIFLGWYIWAKDKQIKLKDKVIETVQEARVQDAKSVNEAMMELNDKWLTALNANTTATSELKTVMTLIRETMQRVSGRPRPSMGDDGGP